MNAIKAFLDGDIDELIGSHADIIFYKDKPIFPKSQDEESFPPNLSSFVDSDLFDFLNGSREKGAPLVSMKWTLRESIDTERNFYTLPVLITDTLDKRRYFINDRKRLFYLDGDDYNLDDEEKNSLIEESKKDRSEVVVIIWHVQEQYRCNS